MNSTASWQKQSAKASSSSAAGAGEPELSEGGGIFEGDRLEFDLSTHLTYLSGIATAGTTRDRLFEKAASVPYSTARYFRSIRLLTTKLGYSYPRACEVVAHRTKHETMRSFLLRFAGSLASGEREADFLARESEVQFQSHTNRYERDLESLRKWTDGFVALEVSVALVVIIALVSMMIFPLGNGFVLGLSFVGIFIAALGGYVIYRSSPMEPFTHHLEVRSAEQLKVERKARYLVPIGLIVGAAAYFATGMLALALIVLGGFLFPIGRGALRYHSEIAARDRDAPAFLRAVGGITGAVGTTVTEAIARLDLRSMGSLEPEVGRLYHRLKAGIRAELCWDRFIAETGSELIRRSVSVFWEGVKSGGDAAKIGYFSSLFAMHVSMLRQKRELVANTFSWLMLPMHATLVGLLMFICQIVIVFTKQLSMAAASNTLDRPEEAAMLPGQVMAFGAVDIGIVSALTYFLIIALTLINGWVPNAAAGGDRYRFCFPLSITLVISGLGLLTVPFVVDMIFAGLAVGTAQ